MVAYRASMAVRRPLRKAVKARRPYRPRSRYSSITTRGVSVPRNILGFPREMITVLRYVDTHTIQSSAGSAGGQVFRLNSVYDPDFTGAGHQPLYYDQLTAIYNKYVVISANVRVDFSPLTDDTESTTTGPYTVGLTMNNSNSWASSGATLSEQNGSVVTMVGRDKGTSVRTLTMNFNTRRDMGMGIDDDEVQAFNNANPSRTQFVYAWAADQNNTSGSVKINTVITYRVKFFDANNVNTS